ncbi:MAG: ABC transporter ATP-binding protein [Thermoplasmata archaeon]
MPALEVRDLKTHFFVERGVVKAVDGVDFDVQRGETVGLAGESGCGKTTTAYSVMRLVPEPGRIVGGEIYLDGTNVVPLPEKGMRELRWKRVAMVFQGAMNALNPVLKISDQITEGILIHDDVDEDVALRRARTLFKEVGLEPERIDNYPHEFSGGMRQRAMIAMALVNNPEFLILDEPTTALDVTMQAQIIEVIRKIQREYEMSLLFITHDLSVLAETCERIVIMYAGKIMESGDTAELFTEPIHPYSKGLVAAIPTVERGKSRRLFSIPGNPPDLIAPPKGCPFHVRCVYAQDICSAEIPAETIPDRGFVACHFSSELRKVSPTQFWLERE